MPANCTKRDSDMSHSIDFEEDVAARLEALAQANDGALSLGVGRRQGGGEVP